MRKALRQPLALGLALLLIAGAFGGAATLGMSDTADEISPVGDAEAIACGGACLVGGAAALGGIAIGAVGTYLFTHDKDVNKTALKQADAAEAKKNIYSMGTTQHQNNLITLDAYSNYLQDTSSVAKMVGKNAYIRALENQSSQATALAKARQAVADYYAAKQIQLANQWDVSMQTVKTLRNISAQHANVSNDFVHMEYTYTSTYTYQTNSETVSSNKSLTLVNSSSVTVTQYKLKYSATDGSGPWTTYYGPAGGGTSESSGITGGNIVVKPPNQNYQQAVVVNTDRFKVLWSEIQSQNQQVQDQITSFVNGTYSKWEQGKINTTDLVDPYLGARQYSPEANYGSWSLRTLSAMGLSPPANLSNVGTMEVTDLSAGTTYSGILMSDGLPANGTFEVGSTYNASKLTGPQYVVRGDTGDSVVLSGKFKLSNVTTPSGNTTTTVRYNSINYSTANLEEFKALQQQLRNLTAAINARQQRLRSGGGGGGLLGGIGGSLGLGLSNIQAAAILAFLALLALAAVSRS